MEWIEYPPDPQAENSIRTLVLHLCGLSFPAGLQEEGARNLGQK